AAGGGAGGYGRGPLHRIDVGGQEGARRTDPSGAVAPPGRGGGDRRLPAGDPARLPGACMSEERMIVAAETPIADLLGLAVDPFSEEALPQLFFVGGQRRFLAQQAVHALYFSGATVLLLGESGAGKSRMLREIWLGLGEVADV